MSWRHLSMNFRLNLPANVFSFRYVMKGPLKSPSNSYFSFCACDFRGDQMTWKKSVGKVLGTAVFFSRVDAVLRQASLIVPKSCYKGQVKNTKQRKLLLSL